MTLQEFYTEFDQVCAEKDLSEVAHWLSEAQDLFDQEHADDILGRSKVRNERGCFYRTNGLFTKAEDIFHSARTLLEQGGMQGDAEYAVTWNNLACLYRVEDQLTQADASFQYSMRLLADASNVAPLQIVYCCNNYAVLLQETGDNEKATELLNRALTELASAPHNPALAASIRSNLAFSYLACEKKAEALTVLNEAVALYEEKIGTEHPAYFCCKELQLRLSEEVK